MPLKMDENETKIRRILRTPSIFNWARILRPRTDQTCFQIERLAEGEVRRSLRPAYRLCRQMALREKSFEECLEKASGYEGFAHDSSTELVELLHQYLTLNQIEVVPEFKDRLFRFPIGKSPTGGMLTVPTNPDFVTIRGETLEPNFLLGWSSDPFKANQYHLVSSIIKIAVLSREDFRGCDARIITFRRDPWSGKRICKSWLVSQFPDVPPHFVNGEILRYNNALLQVFEKLQGS